MIELEHQGVKANIQIEKKEKVVSLLRKGQGVTNSKPRREYFGACRMKANK